MRILFLENENSDHFYKNKNKAEFAYESKEINSLNLKQLHNYPVNQEGLCFFSEWEKKYICNGSDKKIGELNSQLTEIYISFYR